MLTIESNQNDQRFKEIIYTSNFIPINLIIVIFKYMGKDKTSLNIQYILQ